MRNIKAHMGQYEKVGQIIKDRREELRLSQEDVVRELRVWGIETSAPALSRLETGKTTVLLTSPESLEALARILKVGKQRLLKEAGLLPTSGSPADDREYILELLNRLDPVRREIAIDLIQTLADKQST